MALNDLILIVNLFGTLGGLVLVYVKITERLTRVETHIMHLMKDNQSTALSLSRFSRATFTKPE